MSETILPHHHGDEHNTAEINETLKRSEDFQTITDIFKQLGDASRIKIFWILCHREECVINLAALMSMTAPAVSHHLKQLRISGLIVSRREGKEVYYRAAATAVAQLLHLMIEQIMRIACPHE